MENQFYIRIRGRVLGPYDLDKLQSLARRGQLSRMHEVSSDATTWVRASAHPELFVNEDVASMAVSQDGQNARQVPGLVTAPGSFSPPLRGKGDSNDDLPADLCKTAVNSRSWVVFVAVVSFLYAALMVVGGLIQLIQGAQVRAAPQVASGLFGLIFGVDVAAGGFLLLTYASRLASLRFGGNAMVLEKALDTLRAFWIYVSINLIVFLAFLTFMIVWIIAVGGTLL